MKRYNYQFIFVIFITLLIFLTACNNKLSYEPEINNENLELAAKLSTEDLEGKIEILQTKQINGTHYIVLRLFKNNYSMQLWKYAGSSATLLEQGINIHIENKDPYLYCRIIKHIKSNNTNEYKNQLIKFANNNDKTILYEGNNDIEISAGPDGKYLMFIENSELNADLITTRNLKILDKNDKIVYENLIPSNMPTYLEPLEWNGSKFWATLNYPYDSHYAFFIFDTETLKYEIIKNKATYFESELNINTGWICYSTYPHFFDIDTYNDFIKSEKEVYLYLWNIYTDEKIKIDTAIARAFHPKWIDDYNLQYVNPDGEPNKVYTLKIK